MINHFYTLTNLYSVRYINYISITLTDCPLGDLNNILDKQF